MIEPEFLVADESDIPNIQKLVNSAYRGDFSRQGWTTEADFLDGIRIDQDGLQEIINRKNAVILLAKQNGKISGCVHLQLEEDKTYLGMLTVDPTLQAKGLGKKILSRAETWAKEKKSNHIEMTVITLRDELIKWYERSGYYKTGEKKPFPTEERFGIPRQPLEFLVMRKDLQ